LLGGLSALLVWVAARLRGRVSITDALFPLVLLHLGHEDNLFQGFNIQNVCFAVLSGMVLSVLATSRPPLSLGRAVVAGAGLVLLPLNGAAGVGVTPALGLWLAYCGILAWRSTGPTAKRDGLITLGIAAATLALVPLYFRGLITAQTLPRPNLAGVLRGSLMFLTMGFGPAGRILWPTLTIALITLALFAVANLVTAWRSRPEQRPRLVGFLFFLAAMASLAVGVGWGRSGIRPDHAQMSRYALLAVLLPCCLYLSGGVANAARFGRGLQIALFGLVAFLTPLNWQDGLDWIRWYRGNIDPFEKDLLDGMPASFLVKRHDWLVPRWRKEDPVNPDYFRYMEHCVLTLRRAGIGLFPSLKDSPDYMMVPVAIIPSALNEMTWQDGAGYGHGTNPWVAFGLEKPQRVYGIDIEYSLNYGNADPTPADFQVAWTDMQRPKPGEGALSFDVDTGRGIRNVAVWVNGTIDRFRIRPDKKPCVLRVRRITLMVPPTDQIGSP
jgi:hypothetical protein